MRTRPVLRATLIYSALTLLATFPLILHLRSLQPGDPGDPLLSASLLWWNAHVLPLTERWWNGFAFAPAPGMLAFSDHRLGLSLIATPLQWLGASPITAYNLVFLATFVLCALGGYALGRALTGREDAALLCGLAYGFNPFRAAHSGHLELLAGFGMPAALAALHTYQRDHRARLIVAFGVALFIQALCGTYYLLFFLVLSGLWILWFVRPREWRVAVLIACAFAVTAALLSPIAIHYIRIHRFYGFTRLIGEIETYSADLTSVAAPAPKLRLWGFAAFETITERQIFPGLTIVVLAAIGVIAALRREKAADTRWRRLSIAALALSCAGSAIAVSWIVLGRWQLRAGGTVLLRVTDAFKPATIALVALLVALAALPSVRAAWTRRSPFAFYVFSSVFLLACSLGPTATFFGEQVLYKPPYAWFMALPMVGTAMRAPARFAMLMILALSAAAALAFDRLRLTPQARKTVAALAMAGVVADGWFAPIPMADVPPLWSTPPGIDFDTVVELPLSPVTDVVPMYRATVHGHPVANGNSGFFPPHYLAMELALQEGNPRVLQGIAHTKPVLVVVDRQQDLFGKWNQVMAQAEYSTLVGSDRRWTFYALNAPREEACDAPALKILSIVDRNRVPVDATLMTDGHPETRWTSPEPQNNDDALELDLGRGAALCALKTSLGDTWQAWPRDLEVTTSPDGTTWTRQFKGSPGRLLVEGAVANPRDITMSVPLHRAQARFVRMRLDSAHRTLPWLIAELRVTGF